MHEIVFFTEPMDAKDLNPRFKHRLDCIATGLDGLWFRCGLARLVAICSKIAKLLGAQGDLSPWDSTAFCKTALLFEANLERKFGFLVSAKGIDKRRKRTVFQGILQTKKG